jgi:tetraacyldisaccharide 4'-kinase
MLSGVHFRQIVSGQRKGPLAAATRGILALFEWPYQWATEQRNARFDFGRAEIVKVLAPVISVGNLTVGGTGKTPFVAWLAQWFRERHVPVTIISRGYGARPRQQNDEALELAARLPTVPHVQNADRVAAARQALAKNQQQVLILDDAFQHRRIARDLDIVLLDALEPFGCGRLLPRGLLREPVKNLARAAVVALSRSDAVSDAQRREIHDQVRHYAPSAVWLELTHRPHQFISAAGQTMAIDELKRQSLAAFCGIGNPPGFRHTLNACGLDLAAFLELPDHCRYDEPELSRLRSWLQPLDVTYAVCTRKDLVKIPHDELAGKRLIALDIQLEITAGKAELEKLLAELAAPLISSSRPQLP